MPRGVPTGVWVADGLTADAMCVKASKATANYATVSQAPILQPLGPGRGLPWKSCLMSSP